MKKSTIVVIGILLMLAGGLFFLSKDPTAMSIAVVMLGLGAIVIIGALLGLFNYFSPHQHQYPSQQYSYTPSPEYQNTVAPSKKESSRELARKEARKQELNTAVGTLKTQAQGKLWGLRDITQHASIHLDASDVQYIAQQIPTPLFSTNVWELHQKIKDQRLSDEEMFKILDTGTENIRESFMEVYSNSTSWTMSSTFLERLINRNPLMLFSFGNLRKEAVSTIIDRLSAYELQGYRTKPVESGESFDSSFVDLVKSTPENEVKISYYESTNTNIIHFLEQYYPDETALRQKAFTKILTGSANVISMLGEVDDFSEDEIRQIFARNHAEEISALFEEINAGDVVAIFPPIYAVKVALQLVECDYEDQVNENYDFDNIPVATYQQIIAELSADELLGYDARGDGNYDIIKLFEDKCIEDEPLRKLAFDKIQTSIHFHTAIARWENISEDEVKTIMDKKNESEINALFGRDDSEDVVTSLSEDIAIKIRLELIYPDASDTVENSYQFNDENAFKKVIVELSADELLGFRIDQENPGSFSNNADYDIIKLIEDEMQDNEKLRKLAFAKMCESKDMSNAIARWDAVMEEEVKVIMERKNEDEINALFGRDNSEDIICDLPEDVAIRIRLQLIYSDECYTVQNNYQFNDEGAFKKAIAELSADELLGFRIDPTNPESFSNDADYDIIKFIEDEMGDKYTLRTLAFAKICESKNMHEAIARWDSLADEEITVIMKRGIAEEISSLLERDDSYSANMPDTFIITQHLLEDDETIRDEFSSRMDDQTFADKVKKMVKGKVAKELSDDEKEGAVEDLSDEQLLRVKVFLTDIDECSFDSDDVANEFSERMTNNEGFEQNVKAFIAQLS